MSITPTTLQPGIVLANGTPGALITGAVNATTVITRAVASNVSGGAVTLTLYRVPSGGAPGAGNAIVNGRSIAASPTTDLCPELAGMVLAPGDTIQGDANAASAINFFASGYTVTT